MINLFNHYQNSFKKDYYTKEDPKIQTNSEKDIYNNNDFYLFSGKEWSSSFYSYNKSASKPLVAKNSLVDIVIDSYVNMLQIKRTVFNRRRDNKLRYSANKVYTGKAKLEHTNNKVTVKLALYNKKKTWFEKKSIRFIMLIKFWKVRILGRTRYIPYYKNRLLHVLKRNFVFFNKWNITFFREKTSILSYLLKTKWRNLNFYRYIPMINKLRAAQLHRFYNLNNYVNRRLKKLAKLEEIFFNYTGNVNFNTSILTPLLLSLNKLGIISLLAKIFRKKTEINLTEARAVHTDSDIFSSAVSLKLRDRKNNGGRVLGKSVKMVNIPDSHTLITFDDNAETLNKNNVINYIKQQVVSGIRFEASGRLTRRLTAMRAVFKYRYAGSLKNIRSSFNKESATMLRGYFKSNLQHSLVNSKTRNGTFGLKGWVSSHLLHLSKDLLFRVIANPTTQLATLPLRSGIFTINRIFFVGLFSSIITAAIGYGIRLILLNYLEYDIFTNLDNWKISLSYFCSLGGIRFLISEYIKQNFSLMSTADITIPGVTAPNTTNLTSSLAVTSSRGFNDPGIGSSSTSINPITGTTDQNTTGIGSSITGDASSSEGRRKMEEVIAKKTLRIEEFWEQYQQAWEDFESVKRETPDQRNQGDWVRRYEEADSAYKDTRTNLHAEVRMCDILKTKLENGDYSTASTSVLGKRNNNSFGPDNSSTSKR